jgi:CDP-diacylglycerol---glycerol-3-phosphate 3-phosphatidyltransferase
MNINSILPWGLIAFRFFLGPILILQTTDGQLNLWFVFWIFAGLVSDIFDGMIARKLGVATPALRSADSKVDFFFIICLAILAWVGFQYPLREFSLPLLVSMFALYGISILYPWIKFGRVPAYHAYSAKLAGLSMMVAAIGLFGFGFTGWTLAIGVWVSIISHIDRILISYFLKSSKTDIIGFWILI